MWVFSEKSQDIWKVVYDMQKYQMLIHRYFYSQMKKKSKYIYGTQNIENLFVVIVQFSHSVIPMFKILGMI